MIKRKTVPRNIFFYFVSLKTSELNHIFWTFLGLKKLKRKKLSVWRNGTIFLRRTMRKRTINLKIQMMWNKSFFRPTIHLRFFIMSITFFKIVIIKLMVNTAKRMYCTFGIFGSNVLQINNEQYAWVPKRTVKFSVGYRVRSSLI